MATITLTTTITVMTTTTEDALADIALLRLLQLVSPALPVGGFAFSHGLEYAVHTGWVSDEAQLQAWIGDLLTHSIARVDLPLLLRSHRAASAQDRVQIEYWNGEAIAWRETAELHMADVAMGGALVRVLHNLPTLKPLLPDGEVSWPCAFAAAAAALQIPARPTLLAYQWSLAEGQVTAALKLMPLGQSAGQRILLQLGATLPALAEGAAAIDDADIGSGLPGVTLASSWHETQYSRLFRS